MVLYLSLEACPGISSSSGLTKLGGIFCRGRRTVLRKSLLMLLASPRRGGAGPTGNGTLPQDLSASPETPAAGMSPVLTPAVVGHLTDSPRL